MIEFKGECGHTIRAKDENAGKVVRCSYCGREAQVPDEQEDQFDFLMNEVERTGEFESPRVRRASKKAKAGGGKRAAMRPRGDFNPFAVALKMCYAAIIITVLIVGGKYGYRQWISAGLTPGPPEDPPGRDSGGPGGDRSGARPGSSARGLQRPRLPEKRSGIFVNSVPADATVYVRCTRDASAVSILRDNRRKHKGPSGRQISLHPERYEVAVTVKLNHGALMALPGYPTLRRQLEDSTQKSEERLELLEGYFLPDRASRVAIEMLSDYSQVIVRYYEVEVVKDSWTPETALFLPAGEGLSELAKYLPRPEIFSFEEGAVRRELEYCEVPEQDWTYIIDALSRVGMIPYRLGGDGRKGKSARYRLFQISLTDGTISTPMLRN